MNTRSKLQWCELSLTARKEHQDEWGKAVMEYTGNTVSFTLTDSSGNCLQKLHFKA